jgi:hypothetical protein
VITGGLLVSTNRSSARISSAGLPCFQDVEAVMDRLALIEQLALVEEQVEVGERTLQVQWRMVEELERNGSDATEARKLLKDFEQLQEKHLADRDRLKMELARIGNI